MSDAEQRIDAMLCRWAAAKYNLPNVTRVYFDAGQHGPYSDVTPDLDSYVEVTVWTAERERMRDEQLERGLRHGEQATGPYEMEESYSGGLIRDILRFAIGSEP